MLFRSRPDEQDPELWAQYTAALREYKQSEHTLVFASFANGAPVEMCIRDSLQIVPIEDPDEYRWPEGIITLNKMPFDQIVEMCIRDRRHPDDIPFAAFFDHQRPPLRVDFGPVECRGRQRVVRLLSLIHISRCLNSFMCQL